MGSVLNLLQQAAAGALQRADQAEAEAEPALAFERSETENEQIAVTAVTYLKEVPFSIDATLSTKVIASIAMLSKNRRDQITMEIRKIRIQFKLERLYPLRSFTTPLNAFVSQIETANDAKKYSGAKMIFLRPGDHLGAAREFYRTYKQDVRRWCGTWWRYMGTHYEHCIEEHIRNQIWAFLDTTFVQRKDSVKPFVPVKGDVDGVIDALKSTAMLDIVSAPGWIRPIAGAPEPSSTIAFLNGVLDVDGWINDPQIPLIPHSRNFFNLFALPFAFDPSATCPRWETFLNEIFEGDEHRILALRCMIGLLLTPDTSLQKIFVFIGKPRSGKGTILRIISALLGSKNVTQPKLASLTTEFGLSALQGKAFAAFTDVHAAGRDVALAVEVLLAISGEDGVNINRKFKDILTDQKLCARLALVMNEMVRLPDISGALGSRLIVLPFHVSFEGKENTALTGELLTELPGIANWALEGLRTLRLAIASAAANDKPTGEIVKRLMQAPIGLPYLEQFRDISSPCATFLNEECVVGEGLMVSRINLFEEWKSWCDRNEHEPGSTHSFFAKLRSQLPKLIESRPELGGERTRVFNGIALIREETCKKAMKDLTSGKVPNFN